MTSRQKRILVVLAVANLGVTLALILLATCSSSEDDSPLPSPVIERLTPPPHAQDEPGSGVSVAALPTVIPTPGLSTETCQWRAAQMLVHTGLGGKIPRLEGSSFRFEMVYPLAPDETVEDAAQLVWAVFDVALALQAQGCWFDEIDVEILAQADGSDTVIRARVSLTDLLAFDAGVLDESEFVEKVRFSTSQLE